MPAEFAGARVWVRAGMGESGDTYIENPLSPSKMATDDEERCVMTDNSKIASPRQELVCCPLPRRHRPVADQGTARQGADDTEGEAVRVIRRPDELVCGELKFPSLVPSRPVHTA